MLTEDLNPPARTLGIGVPAHDSVPLGLLPLDDLEPGQYRLTTKYYSGVQDYDAAVEFAVR